jgi:hypothetical protein
VCVYAIVCMYAVWIKTGLPSLVQAMRGDHHPWRVVNAAGARAELGIF